MFSKIKQAIVSSLRDDDSTYPETTAYYKGKTQPATRHSVYGVCSQPPKNSLGLLFQVDCSNGVQYGIFDYVTGRFKNLEEGEVQIGNYLTEASIKFDVEGNVIVNVPSGNLTATVSGSATLTVPETTINSDVTINGALSVTGDVTGNNFVSSGISVDFNTHIHTDSMGGDTSAPQ